MEKSHQQDHALVHNMLCAFLSHDHFTMSYYAMYVRSNYNTARHLLHHFFPIRQIKPPPYYNG